MLTARQLAQRLGELTVLLLELAIMLTLSCVVGATFAHARCESDLGQTPLSRSLVGRVRFATLSC